MTGTESSNGTRSQLFSLSLGQLPIPLKYHRQASNDRKNVIFMDHQKMAPNFTVPRVAEATPTVALTRALLSQGGGGGGWHKALVVGSVSLWRRLLASRL